jgi:DNA-binding response OmpR family regulator
MNPKGTILIVEDQPGFRMVYRDLLAQEGYEVLTAEDGLAGWELALESKPNLVLLDLGLPRLDGFEVLRRMRGNAETKTIPVIIFSVMGEKSSVDKAMEMGANDYTVKGFLTPRQVLSKIKVQLIQFEPPRKLAPAKIPVKAGGGMMGGDRCPLCGREMAAEMFVDDAKTGTHWFSTRPACPQCGKPV